MASVTLAVAFFLSCGNGSVLADQMEVPAAPIELQKDGTEGASADELAATGDEDRTVDKDPVSATTDTEEPVSTTSTRLIEAATSSHLEEGQEEPSPQEAKGVLQNDSAETSAKTPVVRQLAETPTSKEDPIAEQTVRMHFKGLNEQEIDQYGLWLWGAVANPSDGAKWPTAAQPFSARQKDDYGYYIDVKKGAETGDIGFLLLKNGEKVTPTDQSLSLISPSVQQVWIDQDFQLYYYRPQEPGTLRINYYRADGQYKKKSLWLWGSADKSITSQLGSWPDGVDFQQIGPYGAYMDIPLSSTEELGFLLLDENKSGDEVKIQPNDYKFNDLKHHSQIFLREDDATIYTNPYFISETRLTSAQQTSPTTIVVGVTSLEQIHQESLLKDLVLTNVHQQRITIEGVHMDQASNKIILTGDFKAEEGPYTLVYKGNEWTVKTNWQYKDALYAYDGELGARVHKEGRIVDLTVWSPSADHVSLVLYDKNNQEKVVAKLAMKQGNKGEWSLQLTEKTLANIEDYRGYFYHYEISRNGQSKLVLDPYAKSLASWNSQLADTDPSYKVAKAAIVDVENIGEKNRSFANIPGFTSREKAVIYEAHVRDFTSDPALEGTLRRQFGTFASFVEKLDYLQQLGVTHIQLLPIMSYYFVDESKNGERLLAYASKDSNYNWGYDPQSYFALTGMYSSDPSDPGKRIAEFKNLVDEIHKRGMGVILDVVYNHTAKVELFEDLEPNYYHFMDANGQAKTSFGGGRLGTTHYMTRRLLVDSIRYLTNEYKVDGFRFDMMGDHDAAAIEAAFEAAKALNPNILMLGEGWVTFVGDDNMPEQPADQSWMSQTDTVASFSDDFRNNLKSGYPNEGAPAFLTGGAKNIWTIFQNIKAQPTNFLADDPGDVIQYIAAHDNLTLFDIIAQSIHKDPADAQNLREIHRRLRLGNTLVLTSQGTPFLHSGQEYGRTKQFKDENYRYPVSDERVPNKSHLLTKEDGTPFDYPYFIHDSYDSSDAVNHFDWAKATDVERYPEHTRSKAYTQGLIALRRSTDAFSLTSKEEIEARVKLLVQPGQDGVKTEDTVIAYETRASNGDRYAVFVNADHRARTFSLKGDAKEWLRADVVVDGLRAGTISLKDPSGVTFGTEGLTLDPLTALVLRLSTESSDETERRLQDLATKVTLVLAKKEDQQITSLTVKEVVGEDLSKLDVLSGQDVDLYDIELVDQYGQKLSNREPVQVYLPIEDGKVVAGVFYLAEDGRLQELEFEEVIQAVDGKNQRFVHFTAEHFSRYGVRYFMDKRRTEDIHETEERRDKGVIWSPSADKDKERPVVADSAKTTEQLPQTGDTRQVWLSLVGLLGLGSFALLKRKQEKESDAEKN
ncbi:Pullulanase [Streptococcus sp. DD13]|nr:Pullulanase [Streptococcus sp. DD13]